MAISDQVQAPGGPADRAVTAWYALSGDEVTARLGVEPAAGLAAARAAELLAKNGPNALPVEKPPSAIGRFLAEFTSYMQIILVGAAVVSLVIQQWATAIVLIVITLFNALVGLRQRGKAESAMNALQSMMKATARVRRDGTPVWSAWMPGRPVHRRRISLGASSLDVSDEIVGGSSVGVSRLRLAYEASNRIEVHGSSETNSIVVVDWFSTSTPIYIPNGRVSVDSGQWSQQLFAGNGADRRISENAVWGYRAPYDEAKGLAGHYAFYKSRVERIEVM